MASTAKGAPQPQLDPAALVHAILDDRPHEGCCPTCARVTAETYALFAALAQQVQSIFGGGNGSGPGLLGMVAKAVRRGKDHDQQGAEVPADAG